VIDCVFCRIIARQTAADIEYEDAHVMAFKDIYPKAPVHVLIVAQAPHRLHRGVERRRMRTSSAAAFSPRGGSARRKVSPRKAIASV